MPKILITECKQEVSTFNPLPSRYDDFVVNMGDELLDYHRGVGTEVAGALDVFARRPELEPIATYGARSITSAGTLAGDDWQRMAREFLIQLHAAPPVDGVYVSLHGAMAAANESDPEGFLLSEVRRHVGPQVPIVASFDLHGILTDRILEQADAVVAFHTYPHVDFYETGVRAAELLLRIMAGDCRPVTARVKIPALVRGDELITATGHFGHRIDHAIGLEASGQALAAGMFIGNPFTDVPDLRSNTFVITDGDAGTAQREAMKMAADFWADRARMQAPLVSVSAAIEEARGVDGTVILVDAADATSSGATGDSNIILRALRDAGYSGSALLPIVDPDAVAMAKEAGIGAKVDITLGGRMDPSRFVPLPLQATVRMLSDGRFVNESHGTTWMAGDSAVLQAGAIMLVVTSRAVSLYDRSLFLAHGQDPRRFDLVVVKSPHCQKHFYADWSARLINVDAPGSTSANLQSLGHTECPRPIYPLDQDMAFEPEVQLFSR